MLFQKIPALISYTVCLHSFSMSRNIYAVIEIGHNTSQIIFSRFFNINHNQLVLNELNDIVVILVTYHPMKGLTLFVVRIVYRVVPMNAF